MRPTLRVACVLVLAIVASASGRNSSAEFTGQWFDTQGHPVSPRFIQVDLGPRQHCGLQSAAFMSLGWPLGSPIEGTNYRSFFRDPKGLLEGVAEGKLDLDARLPQEAVSTGFHRGEWESWVVPSDPSSAYLAGSARVERWPGGGAGCA